MQLSTTVTHTLPSWPRCMALHEIENGADRKGKIVREHLLQPTEREAADLGVGGGGRGGSLTRRNYCIFGFSFKNQLRQ